MKNRKASSIKMLINLIDLRKLSVKDRINMIKKEVKEGPSILNPIKV